MKLIQLLKEIKVNKPYIKAKLLYGDENPIHVYKKGILYKDKKKEIDISLQNQGFDGDWDRNESTWCLISFVEDDIDGKFWWTEDEINFEL